MTRSSEFGRGYATCLRQFAFHAKRLDEQVERYADLRGKGYDAQMFRESDAVELWFNGSSDHFYDLVRPRRGVPAAEWLRARALADRALDIGHGFRTTSNVAEARALLEESQSLLGLIESRGTPVSTLDQAMEADRSFGLAPIKGEWSCSADLEPRS